MLDNLLKNIDNSRLRLFDGESYLADHPDVAAAGGCALTHFLTFGRAEGRVCRKLPEAYIAEFQRAYNLTEQDDPFAVLAEHLAAAPERYLDSASGVHPLLTGIFDPSFYCAQFPGERVDDPLTHYLQIGWRRGAGPNSWFPNAAFLMSRSSFREEGLAPLHEFLLQADDFLRRLRRLLTHEEHRALLAPLVDGEFYLQAYPDVKTERIDPLDHYIQHGIREGRVPSRWFDPYWYAEQAGEPSTADPLLHYRLIGARRGLPPSPLSNVTRQALRANSASRSLEPMTPSETDTHGRRLTSRDLRELAPAIGKRLVISICHDVYVHNVGGIQIFLADEQQEFNAQQVCYWALAPAFPKTEISGENDARELDVVLIANGKVIGRTALAEIILLLEEMAADEGLVVDLVVHSLLGHSPEALVELSDAIDLRATAFWLHDFAAICPSYTLLRNGVEFCGAPPVTSMACTVCSYRDARTNQASRVEEFLRHVRPLVVAPSESALSTWISARGETHLASQILPHGRLEPRVAAEIPPRQSSSGPLRIAYCGHPAPHKGWIHFQYLLDCYGSDPRFEFYHFGAHPTDIHGVTHIEVVVDKTDRTAMTDALCEHEIDLVLALSTWPETFCFVVHEALAAGCQVGVLSCSGNAAAVCERHQNGVVFDDLAALLRYLGTGDAHLARTERHQLRSDLILTGTSARLSFAHEPDESESREAGMHV